MPKDSGVRLRVEAPYYQDEYDPSIEGVEPVTREGTLVQGDHVKTVIQSAADHGVTLAVVR